MKKYFATSLVFLGCALLLSGCQTTKQVQNNILEKRYQSAVRDAVFADAEEVRNLTPITRSNPALFWKDDRVLMVTWTKHAESYPANQEIATSWGDTWVTAAPEVRNFIQKNTVSADELNLRIEESLGMPQNSGNSAFTEIWVRPADLFRPCPDPEIDDTICQTTLPENANADYVEWFDKNILSSYFGDKKYPWTRLGYTFDWGNPADETGLSEFVVKKNSEVIVERTVPTAEYFK